MDAAAQGQIPQASTPQPLSVVWNKTYGGPGQDQAYSLIQVSDGYVMAGAAGKDVSLVKTDLDGNHVWRKTYGGKGDDQGRSVIAVSGGYVVAGYSSSYENSGTYDVYLLKTDLNGNQVWYKTYQSMLKGHLTNAFAKAVIAADDGYVIVGDTNADINGGSDVYLLKTDLDGNLVWNKTYGGKNAEFGNAIIPIHNGYLIAGDTWSYGNSLTSGVASSDIYLMKTDLEGNQVWNKTYGGKNAENAYALAAVDDGYVIAGDTKSHSNSRDYDVYLVKADLYGNQIWERHYGAADDDLGRAIVPVSNGYVITGYTSTIGNFYKDTYLLKTDRDGNVVWSQSYGGADMDEGNAIVQSADGYVIAGYTCSYGIYTAKFDLLKIASDVPIVKQTATVKPTEAPAATQTASGGLTTVDMVIIAVVTIVVIAIAGAAVAAVYLYTPKK